jgi:hypothetical protein
VRSSGDGAARASVRAAVPLPEAPPGDCLPTAVPAARGIVLREAGAPLRAALAEAEGLAASLRSLGVLAARPIEVPQGVDEEVAYRIEQLVDSATQFLAALERAARFSAGGTPLSDEDAAALSRVGQWAESILADAAGAEAVAAADARWAVIDARGTVSGIGGVDALYVVIATPDGLLLARGAVRAFYRDLPWPQSACPFTDEAWRMWLDSATPPPRPQELADVVAAPVPPPPLAGDGFRSCLGPDSGGDLEI